MDEWWWMVTGYYRSENWYRKGIKQIWRPYNQNLTKLQIDYFDPPNDVSIPFDPLSPHRDIDPPFTLSDF